MRKKFIITLFLALFLAITLTACPNGDLKKLDTPTNLDVEGQTMTWNEVANASGYDVDIDGEIHTASVNSFDLSDLQEPKAYRLKVRAKGDKKKYDDSDWSVIRVYQPVEKPGGTEGLSLTLIDNGSAYQVSKGTASCVGIVEVPAQYNGKPITSIANRAFSGCNELTKILLPSSITSIGERAFYDCTSLTEFTIPSGVDNIKNYTFSKSGIKEIVIPNSVTKIERFAFADCQDLEKVDIGSGVISIESYVFSSCSKLKTVNFAQNIELTSIGESAFSECSALTSIEIPQKVTAIGPQGFNKCENLASVTLPKGLIAISERLFYECISLTKIDVPEGVAIVGANAFFKCSRLEEVNLPSTLSNLNNTAFRECESLKSLNVDEDNDVFKSDYNCIIKISNNSLVLGCNTSIIPDYVEIIDYSAFEKCKDLKKVTIPASVKEIKSSAFSNCIKLESVTIEEESELETIGSKAFLGCAFESFVIPESVTIIESESFAFCPQLKNIVIPDSIVEIRDSAFAACVSLENVSLPETITVLGAAAFRGCISLKSFKVPDDLELLRVDVLADCISLENVILNRAKLYAIDRNAFGNCTSLTSITIPSNVVLMNNEIFVGCQNLTIYTEHEEKPERWYSAWNIQGRPVVWGCTLSEDGTYVKSFVMSSTRYVNLHNLEVGAPTRTGYTFAGWTTTEGGTAVEFTANELDLASQGTTLYAIWIKNTYA